MKSTLRLFKALPVKSKEFKEGQAEVENINKKTMPLGFVFSPEVLNSYRGNDELIAIVSECIGVSAKEANSSFHKSWKKIREASIEQLVIEQVMHYMTTYGFERIGCFRDDTVFIPVEKLELPEIDLKKISLTVIRGLTKEEIKDRLMEFLNLGVALNEKTKADVIDVCLFVGVDESDIASIKNKEVCSVLYEYLDMVPSNPTEFLRYMVYKSTEKTLLIKNKELIEEIKGSDNVRAVKLLEKYEKKYGLKRLAEIFFRFKPIFLAFKTKTILKTKINKIRKLADKHHKPMPEDYLNLVTEKIKKGDFSSERLCEELPKVNVFRKVRLMYALNYRMNGPDSVLYKIRNGKSYAKEFSANSKEDSYRDAYGHVFNSIVEDIKPKVSGKKIYIPPHIKYSLPATEKQFTGVFPSGTYVQAPSDIIFGVYWEDVKKHRIDLDLSLISIDGTKIGWDGSYREEGAMFSGDMTSAPKGATELFYVRKALDGCYILYVNFYNYEDDIEVPFKILAAKEKTDNFNKNYMVNPENIIASASTVIDKPQKILGLLTSEDGIIRFCFNETSIGKGISSGHNEYTKQATKYLANSTKGSVLLKDVLTGAGALMVEKCDAEIDLSPEELGKDTILSLIA